MIVPDFYRGPPGQEVLNVGEDQDLAILSHLLQSRAKVGKPCAIAGCEGVVEDERETVVLRKKVRDSKPQCYVQLILRSLAQLSRIAGDAAVFDVDLEIIVDYHRTILHTRYPPEVLCGCVLQPPAI